MDSQGPSIQLIVQEANNDDNSIVQISPNIMSQLKIFKGDVILIHGKNDKRSVAVVLTDNNIESDRIRMNKTLRRNLRVSLGDQIRIRSAGQLPYLTKIHVLPFEDSILGKTENWLQKFITPYFKDAYRPVVEGNIFVAKNNYDTAEFKIVLAQQSKIGIVGPNTHIDTEGKPIYRTGQDSY